MAYRAFDVADYIIGYVDGLKKSITNLQLQKIMYFLQLKFYGETGELLFNEDIEKWKLGPVVPDIYHNYKIYGSNHIARTVDDMSVFGLEADPADFEPDHIEKINETVKNLIEENPFDLVRRTHQHKAWIDYESEIMDGQKGLTYSDDELKRSYREARRFLK